LVRSTLVTSSAVRIEGALNTSLFSSGTSRKRFRAVRIVQAFYALFFSQRTSRGSSRAIGIRFTSEREDASGIGAAFSSAGFGSSPVYKRAMSITGTFDAATSFQVAIRSAVVIALIISSTVVYTDIGDGITILLVRIFTTISGTAGFSKSSASIATSISTAVRDGRRAIGVNGTRSTSSISLASRLTRGLTTIENTTVGVTNASSASSVGLTVVSASVGSTVGVILVVGNTNVRVDTTSG